MIKPDFAYVLLVLSRVLNKQEHVLASAYHQFALVERRRWQLFFRELACLLEVRVYEETGLALFIAL